MFQSCNPNTTSFLTLITKHPFQENSLKSPQLAAILQSIIIKYKSLSLGLGSAHLTYSHLLRFGL